MATLAAAAAQPTPFYDRVKEYYELMNKYNTEFDKLKRPIIKNQQLTTKEKRQQVANLHPKCINCYRPVGTIFNTFYNTDKMERKLEASCGDHADPCNLKIELNMGETKPLPVFIQEETAELNRLKLDIIRIKNRLLVGAISEEEVIAQFAELKDSVNTATKMSEFYQNLYTKLTASPEMLERIRHTQQEKWALLVEMNNAAQLFRKSGNPSAIKDLVSIYVNQFIPAVETLLKETYEECEIVTERQSNKQQLYKLVQTRTTPRALEFSVIEPKVVHFRVGGYQRPRRATAVTPRRRAAVAQQTRKRRLRTDTPYPQQQPLSPLATPSITPPPETTVEESPSIEQPAEPIAPEE